MGGLRGGLRDALAGLARRRGSLAALALLAVAGCAGALALGAAGASSPGGADQPTSTNTCPASNPPNELTLGGGTPQTAKLDSAFASPFQVVLANTNGCPVTTSVAGTVITFSAPSSGPSGTFSASGSSSLAVGTDSTGSASVQGFTANDVAGSYTLTASSSDGSVTFALTNTASGMGATITPQGSVHRSATVGEHYVSPLAVQVLDANGNPVEGATVTFALGSSGGGGGGGGGTGASSAGASFDGGSTQATAQTNASGIATSPLFSANDTAGIFTATASTAGVTEPVSFSLDNVAGKPPKATLVGASHRSAPAGSRYASPLEVEVVDAAGKPVVGASVTFSLGSSAGGGGAGSSGSGASAQAGATFLDGSTTATETTGARGHATSPGFSANSTPGTFTATISVSGLINPLTVELDNLAGRAPTITAVGGAHQTATVEARYARPLELRVTGADGVPVEGTTVTFSLGSGGGGGSSSGGGAAGATFLDGSAQATATTRANGLAVSPALVANGTAGAFTASASVAGVTNPAIFSLDNRAGTIESIGAAHQTATVDARYSRPLKVRVTGARGVPVEGATVTFAIGSGGGGGGGGGAGASSGAAGATFLDGSTQATETTGADGYALSPGLVANGTAGTFTASASIAGVTNPATFALDNLAGAPPRLLASPDPPRTAKVGERYAAPLEVTVRSGGKPVAGATITFSLGSAGGGSGSGSGSGSAGASFVDGSAQATETTNAQGRAVSPAFVANDVAGTFTASASTSGTAGVASFRLRNLAGKASTVAAGAAVSEETVVGTSFSIRFAVTVKDADGNVAPGVVVTFSAPSGGASGSFDSHGRRSRTVRVRTNSDGVAVAPSFAANQTAGGYAVSAKVKGAPAVAFALVNQSSSAA